MSIEEKEGEKEARPCIISEDTVISNRQSEGGIYVTEDYANLPLVVSREEWTAARKDLLAREKELTRQPATP
jgi:hypothetical protein